MSSSALGVVDSGWMKAAAVVPFVGSFVGLYATLSIKEKLDNPAFCEVGTKIHLYEVCKQYSTIGVACCWFSSVACVALVALGFLSPTLGIFLAVLYLVLAGIHKMNADNCQSQMFNFLLLCVFKK